MIRASPARCQFLPAVAAAAMLLSTTAGLLPRIAWIVKF